ncbi:SWF or SNF family helicase [Streptomyces graminilatus]|uniref:SWIM zinc finger family protein n=1 Tax=Streptomyces graminilatus TaxID=1464070 RepID=UPI000AC2DD5C|nr:SWF or SNF family helicase [Streptomyces graminilatus]
MNQHSIDRRHDQYDDSRRNGHEYDEYNEYNGDARQGDDHDGEVYERDAYESDAYGAGAERTFTAPPPPQGRGFAETWWGRAWLKSLEDTALDSEQVRAGRRLARAGAVGAVSVRPGRITAVVQDPDRTTHRSDVLLQELSEEQWDRFLDVTVERAGHIAALLDRDMPPHLVEDSAAAGVELLPGMGDLEPECDCGAWDHCGHTAALCYQVARLLDQDPFVLLLMRGRGERALLDAVQSRGTVSADGSGGPEGVDAAEAYAAGDILPALPALPPLPDAPGTPPTLDTDVPPVPGVDPGALEFLAARTAVDARRLLAEALEASHGQRPVEAELTMAQDAVRLGAGNPSGAVSDRLAEGSGRDREQLASAVRAWRFGGPGALSVLEEEWTVGGETLARARAALDSAWDEDRRPVLRAARNRWTVVGADSQLRLGRDGRWWPYRRQNGRWLPAGQAAQDPGTALAAMEYIAVEEPL